MTSWPVYWSGLVARLANQFVDWSILVASVEEHVWKLGKLKAEKRTSSAIPLLGSAYLPTVV